MIANAVNIITPFSEKCSLHSLNNSLNGNFTHCFAQLLHYPFFLCTFRMVFFFRVPFSCRRPPFRRESLSCRICFPVLPTVPVCLLPSPVPLRLSSVALPRMPSPAALSCAVFRGRIRHFLSNPMRSVLPALVSASCTRS